MDNVAASITTGVIALLILCGVIVGVSAFKSSQRVGDTTVGCNTTSAIYCNAAYNLTQGIEDMSNKFGSQLPTVGTMFGVALILGAIGLIGFGLYRGTQQQ